MPFGSIVTTENAVTPYRKTHVLIDTPQNVIVQQAVSFERIGRAMGRNGPDKKVSSIYYNGIGWRLKSYLAGNGFLYEQTIAQDNIIPSASLLLATGAAQINRNRIIANAEVTGIDTGASGSRASTSFPMIRRLWADTDDISTLALSTAAFNQPDSSGPMYVMDRCAETIAQFTNDREFAFQLDLGSTHVVTPDAVATFYFPGLASETKADTAGTYLTGRGEYALKLYGNGKAVLFERLITGSPYTWQTRTQFQWATSGAVFGKMHVIHIVQTPSRAQGGGAGGTICFKVGTMTASDGGFKGSFKLPHVAAEVLSWYVDQDSDQYIPYKVPRASGNVIASHACQLRVDIRRDLRATEFALCAAKFPVTATIQCDPFKLSNLSIGTSAPFVLQWDCDIPSAGAGGAGAAVDIKLYSTLTNAELPSPTVIDANTKSYPVPAATGVSPYLTDQFYIIATLTPSSNLLLSPTLRSYKVYRDAIYSNTGSTEFEFKTDSSGGNTIVNKIINEIQITGAERDISHEMGSIKAVDVTGSYATLNIRTGMPISVWTEYDPADATKKLWLHDGYVNAHTVTPIPGQKVPASGGFGGTEAFPSATSHFLDIPTLGKWRRLQEFSFPLVAQCFQYGNGGRWTVTDFVTHVLLWAGFTPSEMDIPSSPIELYGKGGSPYFAFETFANGLSVIQTLLADFLGWFLVWDRNIGTAGKWRALPQVRKTTAGFTNVAAFISTGPPQNDGSSRLVHNINSYPLASTLGDGLTYTATAPTIFINKGTLAKKIIPPEGNFLYASCIAQGSTTGVGQLLTVTIPNRLSYNFDPAVPTADPTHRDYMGRCIPIYYIVPSLVGSSGDDAGYALSRIARRIFDFACHAIEQQTFEAPFVALNNEYDNTNKRIFRHYDPVSVDGVQYLVRNCNPHYTKDVAQMAMYELEKPNF